jgi:hypothetical protein
MQMAAATRCRKVSISAAMIRKMNSPYCKYHAKLAFQPSERKRAR